jgi:DNA polymerase I-like protein with 3'-5' exonuclease and polymerase domains
MVELDAASFDMMLQVHDEIALSVENRAEGEAAAEIMRNCTPLELPSKVDVEIGSSWGGSMGYVG